MDRLYYFSRSADRPPGQGANESVASSEKYSHLSRISNWRQMLSNFWVAPFEVDGVRWNSVEHMYQSYKLNLASPEKAWLFTLNSGSELGRSGGDVAQKNRKLVVLTPGQLQEWDQLSDKVLSAGLKAKFSQNPDLKRVLLLTKDAQLWHGAPRTPAERQLILESVRSEIAFEEAGKALQEGRIVKMRQFASEPDFSSEEARRALREGRVVPMKRPDFGAVLTDNQGMEYYVKYDPKTRQIFPL